MAISANKTSTGFSLIELLVVLVIVGILSIAGVMMIGDRQGNAVRGIMDDIEGVLSAARQNAMATGRNIDITASGQWKAGTLTIDARPFDPAHPAVRLGPESERFVSQYTTGNRDHLSAGVDDGKGYATALGEAKPLKEVRPGNAAPFVTALGNILCDGTEKTVTISGTTKRFTTGFCIIVTGLRGGYVAADGPVGLVVVPADSTSIFKFYKRQGESQWRRL